MRSRYQLRRGAIFARGADDAITPCPAPAAGIEKQSPAAAAYEVLPEAHVHPSWIHHTTAPMAASPLPVHPQTGMAYLCNSRRGSEGSEKSTEEPGGQAQPFGGHFDPADGEDLEDEQLWRRMLEIQRHFRCYNSARMDAALEAEEEGEDIGLVPSRTCLDLLNDSIMRIPPEARDEIVHYIDRGRRRRSWRGSWAGSF